MTLLALAEVLPESTLHEVIGLLVRLVECAGAVIIFVGAVWAFAQFLRAGARGRGKVAEFNRIRLNLGRYLVLGLEFQLAGDVLRTAVAPSFVEIGQLAAIAAIRTALNYFLGREIAQERAEIERGETAPPHGPHGTHGTHGPHGTDSPPGTHAPRSPDSPDSPPGTDGPRGDHGTEGLPG